MALSERDLEPALGLWAGLGGARVRLVNHSENHTFRLDLPDGIRFVLRVHRPGYQSFPNIESELAWLQAVRRDTAVPVPEPIAGVDGKLLQRFVTPSGEERSGVLFAFLPGVEPTLDSDLPSIFNTLGRYAATLHVHAMRWPQPEGFVRQAWTAGAILDVDGLWGDWRQGPDITSDTRETLDAVDARLRLRLQQYGMGSERYGLIHADMRLGNLLVDGETIHLIDFDDSGFCWFVYDFAAAISFHETEPVVPALKAAWLAGYREIRAMDDADLAAIDDMVMLRRMALLAWIGSHSDTELAQKHRPNFAKNTAHLGQRYLSGSL